MPPTELIVPVVVLLLGFLVYCLVDVFRAPAVRFLPRWAWAVVCLISVPTGGLVYLFVGRDPNHVVVD